MENIAYIGIGTNIGDRKENLDKSIVLLGKEKRLRILQISSVYETAPVGYVEQAAFLNLAVKVETQLSPQELLEATSLVENEMGRERLIHWGPRIIDLDILMYFKEEGKSESLNTERLVLPHPRVGERAFVIIPLLELSPDLSLNGCPLRDYLSEIQGQEVNIWLENH